MKTSKFFIITLVLLAFALDMTAQGLKVHKKNGEVVTYFYHEIDSIVAFGYGNNDNDNDENINAHEAVDLGLPSGTLWATCNVGADSPADYGDYFAWGETSPKSNYDLDTYKWGNYYEDALLKYNTDPSFGTVDNKTILEPSDDAATANWGSSWRIPTLQEWEELGNETYCTWTWATKKNSTGESINGCLVTSKSNGNSIFLPTAGFRVSTSLYEVDSGNYWSSSLDLEDSHCAYALTSYLNDNYGLSSDNDRCVGLPVRPVRANQPGINSRVVK